MTDKILFMILDDEIKFLSKSSTMDHKEWYKSLGRDMEQYDSIIRGFVIENYIIFFKANLNYDSEVIDIATICGPIIKKQLNRPELKVCCGINPGQNGAKWEPIVMLKGKGLEAETNSTRTESRIDTETKIEEPIEELKDMPYDPVEEQQDEKKETIEKLSDEKPREEIIKFYNNFSDDKFVKNAIKFNIVIIIISIIVKISLFATKKLMIQDRWGTLLVAVQIISLLISTYYYSKKKPNAKYISLLSTAAHFFMFDLGDIILGILILFHTIDQNYIRKLIEYTNKLITKAKELIAKFSKNKDHSTKSDNKPQNNEQDNPKVYPVSNMGEAKPKNTLNSLDDLTNNNIDNTIL